MRRSDWPTRSRRALAGVAALKRPPSKSVSRKRKTVSFICFAVFARVQHVQLSNSYLVESGTYLLLLSCRVPRSRLASHRVPRHRSYRMPRAEELRKEKHCYHRQRCLHCRRHRTSSIVQRHRHPFIFSSMARRPLPIVPYPVRVIHRPDCLASPLAPRPSPLAPPLAPCPSPLALGASMLTGH